MSKTLQKKVYEGDVIQPVKVLGVTIMADDETVASYNESLKRTKSALARLKAATWVLGKPDEKNVIDQ